MAVDAQNPGKIRRYLFLQLEQGNGHVVEFSTALRLEVGSPGVEEHFRLQHKAVADHAYVRTVAENFTKLAEEIRAVPFQLVHPLCQSQIEPLTEFGDAGLRLLILFFRGVERLFNCSELAAQSRYLLVEYFHLRQRTGRNFLLTFELASELGDPALSRSSTCTRAVSSAL